MIPAVEAVERLASVDVSNESDASKSKILTFDAPQDYLSLPTVHIAETATFHISQAIEGLHEMCGSDLEIPQVRCCLAICFPQTKSSFILIYFRHPCGLCWTDCAICLQFVSFIISWSHW